MKVDPPTTILTTTRALTPLTLRGGRGTESHCGNSSPAPLDSFEYEGAPAGKGRSVADAATAADHSAGKRQRTGAPRH